jgi:hypothetical protein
MVNLSGVNNSSLNKLFTKLSLYCVILLKDINAVGLAHIDGAGTA